MNGPFRVAFLFFLFCSLRKEYFQWERLKGATLKTCDVAEFYYFQLFFFLFWKDCSCRRKVVVFFKDCIVFTLSFSFFLWKILFRYSFSLIPYLNVKYRFFSCTSRGFKFMLMPWIQLEAKQISCSMKKRNFTTSCTFTLSSSRWLNSGEKNHLHLGLQHFVVHSVGQWNVVTNLQHFVSSFISKVSPHLVL